MTTFEKCKAAKLAIETRHRKRIAGETDARCMFAAIADSWVQSALDNPHLCGFDPCDLTEAECDELGLTMDESDPRVRLVPMWMTPFLSSDIETFIPHGEQKSGAAQ